MAVAPRSDKNALSVFRECFGAPRALIGMLHLGALPGTPSSSASVQHVVDQAVTEARIYRDAGFTALAIENMHDRPYLKGGVGPEITAAMTAVAREVKRDSGLVLGIQVLAGANREALAIAHASGGDFVRVEGFVYAHVADEGLIESCAGELLRYRRTIGAEKVLIFADIKKKHGAHAMTADVSIVETAKAAEFFLADGVIVGPRHSRVPERARGLHAGLDRVRRGVVAGDSLAGRRGPRVYQWRSSTSTSRWPAVASASAICAEIVGDELALLVGGVLQVT